MVVARIAVKGWAPRTIIPTPSPLSQPLLIQLIYPSGSEYRKHSAQLQHPLFCQAWAQATEGKSLACLLLT